MKLEIPETFEDVAVDFSMEEWNMLTKEDKLLYREVMAQNFDHMVSVGYNVPLEHLLLRIEKHGELPFNMKLEDLTVVKTDLPKVTQTRKRMHENSNCECLEVKLLFPHAKIQDVDPASHSLSSHIFTGLLGD
ncbi:putative protein ZNF720 [Protopterus annectens]|uniref:putative protein ZNF720 n=1 Tax=Protopterus annectens TaxID=7888 RepID=UPI001CFB7A33|nr:putative protein ZNF720 [Protopterus annectens]